MRTRGLLSFFLFIMLVFLASANMALFAPHEIHLAHEFGVSILAIDFIMFLFMAAASVSLPLWGFSCDNVGPGGRVKLLFAGTAIWVLSSIIIYFTRSYMMLLLARTLGGVGVIVIYPISFSMITDFVPPEKRGKFLAFFPAAIALGIAVGIILANSFGGMAWRPSFLAIGLAGLVFLGLSLLMVHEPERGRSEPELRELIKAGCNYTHKINFAKLGRTFQIKTNRWFILAEIAWTIPLGILSYKFIPYLEMYGFGAWEKTLLTFWLGVGIIGGYFLGGMIGDWAKSRNIGRIAVNAASLSVAIILFVVGLSIPRTAELWSANTSLFLFFLFFGAVFAFINVPNIYAMQGAVNEPETRGMFFSIFTALGFMGMGSGVLLGGFFTQANLDSYRGVLLMGILIWVLTILFWLPLASSIKKDSARLREVMARRAEEMA